MSPKQSAESGLHKPVAANIPAEKIQRDRLKETARSFVSKNGLTGPVGTEKLRLYALEVLQQAGLDQRYWDFAAVVVNNEIWRPVAAAVPFEKRLLLLPRCLRDEENCRGEFDQFGLICKHCGRCEIDRLSKKALDMGYAVLVAEGSPVVMGLIESGRVEAVIGVSCLSMLEKVFPYMEAAAVPGAAIPLLYDGCKRTAFDVDWLAEAMEQKDLRNGFSLDVRALQTAVRDWFGRESLCGYIGWPTGPVEQAGLDWLCRAGKRYRPILAAGVYASLSGREPQALDEDIKLTAVAVECFHKASLIHDDIEDGDLQRYGQKTLHTEIGTAAALNVGDYLLGLGYELLSRLKTDAEKKSRMLAAAARGHKILCIGQGAELDWRQKRYPMTVQKAMEIYEQKTAPAFEVALQLGAILAGGDGALPGILSRYSVFLGRAYQIQDDLRDWQSSDGKCDMDGGQLSLLPALALACCSDEERGIIERLWSGDCDSSGGRDEILRIFNSLGVQRQGKDLLAVCRDKAIETLAGVGQQALKGFLRRVLSKILGEFEDLYCCEDVWPKDA